MPNMDDLFDTQPKLVSYLKQHFNGVATAWFYEPFTNNPQDDNGLTIVLNREPMATEKPFMVTELDGFKVRWETPTQKFKLPEEEPTMTISVKLKPKTPGNRF